jgi:hypothetical protein
VGARRLVGVLTARGAEAARRSTKLARARRVVRKSDAHRARSVLEPRGVEVKSLHYEEFILRRVYTKSVLRNAWDEAARSAARAAAAMMVAAAWAVVVTLVVAEVRDDSAKKVVALGAAAKEAVASMAARVIPTSGF